MSGEREEDEERQGDVDGEDKAGEGGDDGDRSESSDGDLAQESCLPVSGAPLPPSDEPAQDADEYLRRVQWERMHCPQIVTADVRADELKKPRKRGVVEKGGGLLALFAEPEVPAGLQLTPEWSEDVCLFFRALRERCDARRGQGCPPSMCAELGALSHDAWVEKVRSDMPVIEVLASLDVVALHGLLAVVVDCVEDLGEAEEAGEHSDMASCTDQPLPEWAFAVLAFCQLPLCDDVQYQLQRLRRRCLKVLAATPEEGADLAGKVPRLNLLIAITRDFFGQR